MGDPGGDSGGSPDGGPCHRKTATLMASTSLVSGASCAEGTRTVRAALAHPWENLGSYKAAEPLRIAEGFATTTSPVSGSTAKAGSIGGDIPRVKLEDSQAGESLKRRGAETSRSAIPSSSTCLEVFPEHTKGTPLLGVPICRSMSGIQSRCRGWRSMELLPRAFFLDAFLIVPGIA